ncbi:hypothetical protein [Geomonas propionica]|uniref:hypothetical protein n=1 Tax=Geomonas propionica TaxID=2798582 RepID=UPI001F44B797|nr:hypothetical protein [Geomonas propionica]
MRKMPLKIVILVVALFLVTPIDGSTAKVKSLCDITYPSDSRIQWSCRKLKWSDTPQGLFGYYWRDVLRFNRMDRRHFLGGRSIKVPKDLAQVKNFNPMPLTYPQGAREPKLILNLLHLSRKSSIDKQKGRARRGAAFFARCSQ